MTANIINWLLRLVGNVIGFWGRCLGALLRLGTSLLSAVTGVLAWPFRRSAELFGLPNPLWLVLEFMGLILILFVLFLLGHFCMKRNEKNR